MSPSTRRILSLLAFISCFVSSISADSVDMPPGYYHYYCYDTPVFCCWNTSQLVGNWSLIRYNSEIQITCGELEIGSVENEGRGLDLSATFRTFTFDPIVTQDVMVNATSLELSSGRWVSRRRLFSNAPNTHYEMSSLLLLGYTMSSGEDGPPFMESFLFATCEMYSLHAGSPPLNSIREIGILVREGFEDKYSNVTLLQNKYNRALSMANLPLVDQIYEPHFTTGCSL